VQTANSLEFVSLRKTHDKFFDHTDHPTPKYTMRAI